MGIRSNKQATLRAFTANNSSLKASTVLLSTLQVCSLSNLLANTPTPPPPLAKHHLDAASIPHTSKPWVRTARTGALAERRV